MSTPSDDDDLDDPMLRALAAAPAIELGIPELPVDTVVGQSYRIVRTIGAGAMGVVYEATDIVLSRQVALKVHEIGRSDRAARHWREARAMAQLSHPNVVAVYEVGVDGDRGFIAMELVHGTHARAWRKAATRTWPEILDLYRQAATGLAAAHDAGLVHRDFKPDNVLIGNDGRVRVADFGLALRPPQDPEESTGGSSRRYDSVTRTGTTMGTPAYMAPEQARRQAADARSDQYAFCVSLHEALYGRRPVRANARTQRDAATPVVEASPVARDRSVPAWIGAVVQRGLAPDPADRHPDMHALLAALDPGPRRRRRVTLALLGGAAVGGGILLWLGGWLAGEPVDSEPCRDAGAAIDETWSADEAARLRDAFETQAPSLAASTRATVLPALEAWATDWRAEAQAACEATHVRGEQSPQRLDLRMDCLGRARRRLVAVVDLLAEADAAALLRAEAVVGSLPDASMCARPDAAIAADPVAPEAAEAYARLSADLDRAVATSAAGRHADAEAILDPLVPQLRDEGFTRELAEALRVRGAMRLDMGRRDEAIADTSAATAMTMRFEDRDAMAQATLELARAYGRAAGGYEASVQWLDTTRALARDLGWSAERLGELDLVELENAFFSDHYPEVERLAAALLPELEPDDTTRVRVLTLLATALQRQSRFEEALQRHDEALALVERLRGPEHPQTAMVLGNRTATLLELSKYDDAAGSLQRVLAIRRAVFGPQAPIVGEAVRELGDLAQSTGDIPGAIVRYEEAIEIHRAAHDDVGLFFDLGNLGPMHLATGDAAAAERRFDEALAAGTRAFGADSLRVAQLLVSRSEVLAARGDNERAKADLQRALATMATQLPADDLNVGLANVGLGVVTAAGGDHDEGIARFDEGYAIVTRKLPPQHPNRVPIARARVQLLLDAGRADAAVDQAREAAALADAILPETRPERADAWLGLATTLLDLGRRAEALEALEHARTRLATVPGDDPARTAEIDAALARARPGGRARPR